MRKLFVLIYVLFSTAPIWAADWTTIINATSSAQLMRSDQELMEKHKTKKACDYERAERSFPYNCLKHLEAQLSQPLSVNSFQSLKKETNQLCETQYRQVSKIERLRSLMESKYLNKSCLKNLKMRLSDLEYIASQ